MNILVSGSTGLIGSALMPLLAERGHTAGRLVRAGRHIEPGDVRWDPADGTIDETALQGCDAVVHLAGENIAGRWTREKKARIRDSRIEGTSLICKALARLERPPSALLCASAMGYYGNRGEEILTEESEPGSGFLADVGREWEEACRPATEAGIRVVNLRFAMILSSAGGALRQMLTPFRLGLGGRVGSGKQYWSWIAIDDAVSAIAFALESEKLSGPVNVASPNPVTNREFASTLGRVLHRPACCPMPAFAARLLLGQMADELLLSSVRAQPKKLQDASFVFRYPELEVALRGVL